MTATRVTRRVEELKAERAKKQEELDKIFRQQQDLVLAANKELDPDNLTLQKKRQMLVELKDEDELTQQEKDKVQRKINQELETLQASFDKRKKAWEEKLQGPQKRGHELRQQIQRIDNKLELWDEVGRVIPEGNHAETPTR